MGKLVLSFVVFFSACGFEYEREIRHPYMLIGIDSRDNVSICYKLSNGDCVGRIPPRVTEYFFNDSLIIAKTINKNLAESFYILNTLKDSEYADYTKSNVLIGPMQNREFDSLLFNYNLTNIRFKRIK